jgi:hypothetical protein
MADETDETFAGYLRNIRRTFNKETREWPREHTWEVVIIIALPLVALWLYGVEIDYKLLWTTFVAYAAAFLVYCVVQFCRAPWKFHQEEAKKARGIIAAIEQERDDAQAELEKLRSALPVNRPVVIPVGYGRYQETKGEGLLIANDEYAANTVSIPDIAIGQTTSVLSFKGTLPRLAHGEEHFFEALIRHPDRPERDGDQLYRTMVFARVNELKVGIVYQATDFRAYRSNCIIRRKAGEAGLEVEMVGQEPIDALPSAAAE